MIQLSTNNIPYLSIPTSFGDGVMAHQFAQIPMKPIVGKSLVPITRNCGMQCTSAQ